MKRKESEANTNFRQGKVIRLGDNINTDIISPPQYMELGIADSSQYAMSAVRPDFAEKVKRQTIIAAGDNFGSGSSRETSPLSLKYLGVEAIVAKFFARIFYRNAINIGLPVIECSQADQIQENDEIRIEYTKGIIYNISQKTEYECSVIPEHLLPLIEAGGLVNYLKQNYSDRIL